MQTLRNAGYCWVTIQDDFIAPLQLLRRAPDGGVDQLNTSIETIFSPNTFALPSISRDVELAADMSGDQDIDLTVQANVSVLQSLLKVFSKNLTAGFNLQNSSTGRFRLVEPKKNFIDIGKLDAFIGDADLVPDSKSIVEDLKADKLYVITDVIKTKGFTLENTDEHSRDFTASAGTTVADADLTVKTNNSTNNIMSNFGDTYLTVAVKAYRIFYHKPGFFSGSPEGFHISPEQIKVFRGDDTYPGTVLNGDMLAGEKDKA